MASQMGDIKTVAAIGLGNATIAILILSVLVGANLTVDSLFQTVHAENNL